ncbi:hypothetical protein TNCV_3062431 [Trichonephila clavipes]|nr:hypothetical protein TNCV_3062431 [Trichonephila clavipes]
MHQPQTPLSSGTPFNVPFHGDEQSGRTSTNCDSRVHRPAMGDIGVDARVTYWSLKCLHHQYIAGKKLKFPAI